MSDDSPGTRSKAERYEGTAFTFCKAATIILLTQKFALPVAAGAAAIFYVLAYRHGARESRCILKWPLLIAAFWGTIAAASLYLMARAFLTAG